jgi:hypothetical protein
MRNTLTPVERQIEDEDDDENEDDLRLRRSAFFRSLPRRRLRGGGAIFRILGAETGVASIKHSFCVVRLRWEVRISRRRARGRLLTFGVQGRSRWQKRISE